MEEAGYVGKYVGKHSSNESYVTKDDYLRPSSTMSVRSKSSSTASRSSAIVLEKKAQLAALEQEKVFRQKEDELERARLQNEQTKKMLLLEKQEAMARATINVFQAAMEGDYELNADLEQDFTPNHDENNKQGLGGAITHVDPPWTSNQVYIDGLRPALSCKRMS